MFQVQQRVRGEISEGAVMLWRACFISLLAEAWKSILSLDRSGPLWLGSPQHFEQQPGIWLLGVFDSEQAP